ncbi:MAG: RNA-binding transcriptional accessory protein [Lachnospiraceae bacterium]|nr:RNA-binding transcriptional accessory protein [Lachnospiraceae bacterium]
MNISGIIAKELELRPEICDRVIRLIDEGNTIPFIARYRKEMTGGMSDEVLRSFFDRLTSLRNLEERRSTILASIEEQGKLTEKLRKDLENAMTLTALEDLYRPYKQKRRTRAMIAKEQGLEPLALYLRRKDAGDPLTEAGKYIDHGKNIPDAQTALQGACDIIAEEISDNAEIRTWIRERTRKEGKLTSEQSRTAKAEEKKTADRDTVKAPVNKKAVERAEVYENYYAFSEPVSGIPGHRVLAINRGERERILTVHVEATTDEIKKVLVSKTLTGNKMTADWLRLAAEDAYDRLIAPSIENELRSELTEAAEDGAIRVFASNLEQLLMQAPIRGKVVLGWDPAFRTGCKLAVVDATGRVLDTTVIYPTAPQNKVAEAKKILYSLCTKYHVDLISLGNGTASRESEKVIADFLKEEKLPVQYAIVNEAGASVYSASPLATEEFPGYDVGLRSAASIARRLQDPLSELVKIDPKSIGVGQYQHDMNQKKLGAALDAVVEDSVNRVGVDVNTASASLLSYVAGIGKVLAKNIVAYREDNGSFRSRRDLLKVPKLGKKAFEQCAGFLRIPDGKEFLDRTAVHPESYDAAKKLLTVLGITEADLAKGGVKLGKPDINKLEKETGLGAYTLGDILSELEKPGRDPRSDVPPPILRSDVMEIYDLREGMELTGTVRNIVDFGAFVDIGVHQDGLVHLSQLADRYVKHPLEVVHVGDVVHVRVLEVDEKKHRISLSMKGLQATDP